MANPTRSELPKSLWSQREAFRAFLQSKLGNAADAEDVLQTGLLKALQHGPALRDDTRLTAWFYRILRHAVIDHIRSRQAARAREHAWSLDPGLTDEPSAQDERALCRCLEPLLSSLKPKQADLLRLVEFNDRPVAEAAASLGISANTASVTLHRARRQLRQQLEAFCGDCASGACLDCDCPPAPP